MQTLGRKPEKEKTIRETWPYTKDDFKTDIKKNVPKM
jgi:hypothetical protein